MFQVSASMGSPRKAKKEGLAKICSILTMKLFGVNLWLINFRKILKGNSQESKKEVQYLQPLLFIKYYFFNPRFALCNEMKDIDAIGLACQIDRQLIPGKSSNTINLPAQHVCNKDFCIGSGIPPYCYNPVCRIGK